eukprot:11368364-Karenia_brevis.AAC.1
MRACQTALNIKAQAAPTASGQGVNTSGSGCQLEQVFACEIEPTKKKWIDLVINTERRESGKRPICIFCDIRDMDKTR